MRRSEDRHGTAFSELSASFVEALGQACCLDDLTEILLEATDCFFRRYPSSENTRIVDKAIDYILRNYSDEKLNIPFLASQLYLSSGYLSLLFKKETSKTINPVSYTHLEWENRCLTGRGVSVGKSGGFPPVSA